MNLPQEIRRAYDWVCVFALIAVTLTIIEVEMVTRAILDTGYEKTGSSKFVMREGSIGPVARGMVSNTDTMRSE